MNSVAQDKWESSVRQIKSLPALPVVLLQLMEYLEKPASEIDVNRIAQLVSYDESIAAQCVRMTNSAIFGRRRPAESIRDAVVALGLWRISDIVFSCTIPQVFSTLPNAIDPAVFWRHSLSCALLSQKLAKMVNSQSAEKAYLAGLLHDLGILVNAAVWPDEFKAALEQAASKGIPIDEAEAEVLGFRHTDSGRVIAEAWQFSGDLAAVLEFHHNVNASPRAKDLVAVVHLSDLLCRHRGMGYGFYEERLIDFKCSPAWLTLVRTCRQMDPPDVARFTSELLEYATEVGPSVEAILGQYVLGGKPADKKAGMRNNASATASNDLKLPLQSKDGPVRPQARSSIQIITGTPSDQKKVEAREVKNQMLDLERIVECSDEAIVAVTQDGIVTYWNPSAEKIYGFSVGEVVGRPIETVLKSASLEEIAKVLRALRTECKPHHLDAVLMAKDGKHVAVSLSFFPIRDRNGKWIGTALCGRNQAETGARRPPTTCGPQIDSLSCGFVRTATDGTILQTNPSLCEMLGYNSASEIANLSLQDLYCNPIEYSEAQARLRLCGSARNMEVEWKRKDGTAISLRLSGQTIRDEKSKTVCHEWSTEDITESRELKHQLRQAQKMEAIGRLAGGIAHDFNNLLGVIIGYSELLVEHLDNRDLLRKDTEEIRKASDRAASLIRQLLAFSRQQVLEPRILNLNTIVLEMANMLQRLLREDIELRISLAPSLGNVRADRGQLEQVIMNLAVNARDALPGGGTLTIESQDFEADREFVERHKPMPPGRYAVLLVTDSGTGMDAHTRAHLFEPFFTTKEPGKGTGLGLATVYGVVKQSDGYIWVESEPGLGTTFRIYFPQVGDKPGQNELTESKDKNPRGTETILVVEDEESLRTLTCSLLHESGYNVLVASNGLQAMDVARNYAGEIHLLLTDMIMPGMNGYAVARNLASARPEMKIIYMSGYTGLAHPVSSDEKQVQISKPFTRTTLLCRLREVLDPAAKLKTI